MKEKLKELADKVLKLKDKVWQPNYLKVLGKM